MSKNTEQGVKPATLTLVVRRLIRATPEQCFDAWSRPEELLRWWGPRSVTCTSAEVDLRVGGRYRIANQFPDGATLWISGEFAAIERPRKLMYTWRLEPGAELPEQVTVTFTRHAAGTEVIVAHERISDAVKRDRHEQGWIECLDGLEQHLARCARAGG